MNPPRESEAMTPEKARAIISYCKDRHLNFFNCHYSEADYKESKGFLEGYERGVRESAYIVHCHGLAPNNGVRGAVEANGIHEEILKLLEQKEEGIEATNGVNLGKPTFDDYPKEILEKSLSTAVAGLEKIANQDYRGNRSTESEIAFRTLATIKNIK